MNNDIDKLIARSQECLNEAQQLIEFDFHMGAINRAYYCMFDAARALLYEKEIFVKTHKGVHTKFNEVYIKTALFERNYSDLMRDVFELRLACDYDFDAGIGKDDAAFAINAATQFLNATKEFLSH